MNWTRGTPSSSRSSSSSTLRSTENRGLGVAGGKWGAFLEKDPHDTSTCAAPASPILLDAHHLLPHTRQWKQSKDFNLLTLYFREPEMEKQYRLSALPAFKCYAACTFLVFLCNFTIQMLVTNRPPALAITYSITFLLFLLLLFVCFSEHLTKCVQKGPDRKSVV